MTVASKVSGLRSVTVVGGGIAGLTVAHELLERGFAVQVVEHRTARDHTGQSQIALGGLACSQFTYVPSTPGRDELERVAVGRGPMRPTDRLPDGSVVQLRFVPATFALTPAASDTLASWSARLAGPLRRYSLELRGATGPDDPSEPPAQRQLRDQRVSAVKALLLAAGVDESRISVLEPQAGQSSVEVRLRAARAPGEHGFRFVPACYRHLHDLLRRIPLYDDSGNAQRTVADRLTSVESQWLARQAAPSVELPRGRSTGAGAMFSWVTELGYSARDAAWLLLRLGRFATSCAARRSAQCEDISFWDWCTLRRLEPQDGPGASEANVERLPYSAAFLEYLQHLPRALVAMDALHADARTQAAMYLQLVRDQVLPGKPVDAVFDAPTSDAWFRPWREHLERLGVRFYSGRLVALEARSGSGQSTPRLNAHFEPVLSQGLDGFDPNTDYVVLALDLVAAQRLAQPVAEWGLQDKTDVGVFADLQSFVLEQPPSSVGGEPRVRDPEIEAGRQPWDRLQTLSGVQYFCGHRTSLTTGFGYFLDSEWALTSVTHTEHWRKRLSLQNDGFLSLISVDIGEFRAPSRATGRAASTCTADQLAHEVWRQIHQAVSAGGTAPGLPLPLYYHVDENLEFGPDGVTRNRTPYLINVAGDWRRRPGPEPFDPHACTAPERSRFGSVLWQAPHGGYCIHFDKFVFAGTYLRTFTRLTTMESANESARHAVNAILDHVAQSLGAARPQLQGFPRNAAVPSGVGDYCPIWPPEQHEFAELEFLRRLDEELLQRGLPHLIDILDLDELPLHMNELAGDPLLDFLRQVADRLQAELDSKDPGNSEALLRLLQLIREGLEGSCG